jgi:hypothetical protein
MNKIIFILMCLFLVSCGSNTLEIISTGEKVELSAHPYVVGDTVILYRSAYSSEWSMDENWTFLSDTTFITSTGSVVFFKEAAVID